MRKGITARDVLRCLYWSTVYNIQLSWNLLIGHPGECIEWVHNIVKIIPKIYHLPPPRSLLYVKFQRRSPICDVGKKFHDGVPDIRLIPDSRLRYLYPEDWDYLNLSYEFENPYEIGNELMRAHEELASVVQCWRNLWKNNVRPKCYCVQKMDSEWTVYDTRANEPREYRLSGAELDAAKQLVCNRDKERRLNTYTECQSEICSLIDREIAVVLDGYPMWLPILMSEMKERVKHETIHAVL
jgi:hypothetical protein